MTLPDPALTVTPTPPPSGMKLASLKCFPKMHEKVLAGVSLDAVAAWIQEECLEYTEVKRASLVRSLIRYKKALPSAQPTKLSPATIEAKIEKMKRGISEVEELEKLYLLRLARVSDALSIEEKMKFPLKQLDAMMDSAQETLLALVEVKLKTGILKKTPDVVEMKGNVSHTHKAAIAEMPAEQRQKLGAVAAVLLDRLLAAPAPQPQQVEEAEFEVVADADDESDPVERSETTGGASPSV